MGIEERPQVILQYLGISQWRNKQRQARDYLISGEVIDDKQLCVILVSPRQKSASAQLINAMFASKKTCYIDSNCEDLEKIIVTSAIILYDENLTFKKTELDETLRTRGVAIAFDRLNCAKMKKQTMMSVYAVSDFAT